MASAALPSPKTCRPSPPPKAATISEWSPSGEAGALRSIIPARLPPDPSSIVSSQSGGTDFWMPIRVKPTDGTPPGASIFRSP